MDAAPRRDRDVPAWTLLVLLALVSLFLNHAYLRGGFQADDLLLLNLMHQEPRPYSFWSGFWALPFERWPNFTSLWWFEPGVRGAFFRPFPSLVFATSVRLCGENALPLHFLSILLHAGVAFAAFLLFARLGAKRLVSFLAALIFLACEDHSMGIGWIATMTDLLCVQFIMLALLAHLRWRRTHRLADLLLVLVPLALAFGSKETAVVVPILIVLLELLLPAAGAVVDRWRLFASGWRDWSPPLAALLVYLAIYKVSGAGMRNLMYVDPLTQPLAYLRHLALHLPVMFLATVTPLPPSAAVFQPAALVPMALAGLAAVALLVLGLWPLRRDPLIRWTFVAYLIVLLPQLGADASERLLYFPFVPATFFLASLLVTIRARRGAPTDPPFLTRALGWAVLLVVLVPGFILSAAESGYMVRSLRKPERDVLTSLDAVRARRPAEIVLLNTSGPFITFYPGGVYEYHLGRPQPTRVLSSLSGKMTIERLGTASIVLRTDRPGWLSNMFARVARWHERLTPGRVYPTSLFDATLLELTPDGRDALAVRFDFRRALDDPSLLFLVWDGARFAPFEFGSLSPGERRPLADTADVWAGFM